VQLGFVTAIVPELSLEEVFALAAEERFDTVEVMCWPRRKAGRRDAGAAPHYFRIPHSAFRTNSALRIPQSEL
jgi:sugar phosphate isomerase/epimerase